MFDFSQCNYSVLKIKSNVHNCTVVVRAIVMPTVSRRMSLKGKPNSVPPITSESMQNVTQFVLNDCEVLIMMSHSLVIEYEFWQVRHGSVFTYVIILLKRQFIYLFSIAMPLYGFLKRYCTSEAEVLASRYCHAPFIITITRVFGKLRSRTFTCWLVFVKGLW